MNFGHALRLCRTQRGISQEKLAELTSLSANYISLLENNQRDPSISAAERIAQALEVPLSIMMFLGAERNEIKELSPELNDRLSATIMDLLSAKETGK